MVLLKRLAAAFCLLLCTAAAAQSSRAIEIPGWFAESFLDFRDDVRDAAASGRRVMIYFGQDGCPYCKRLMEANFSQRDIADATRRDFVPIALNLWGDRETVWLDGRTRSEKDLAAHLRVQFTPTLLFLDEKGAVALRLNGYQPPPRFRLALAYAAKAKPGGETLAQYLAARPPPQERTIAPAPGVFREAPLALAKGRPTLVLFDARVCDPCAEVHDAFRRPELQAALKSMNAVRVDSEGTRLVTTFTGVKLTEAQFAASSDVSFRPALRFYDADGNEVFRIDGYVRRFHLASSLDYVLSGAYKTQPSFQRYLQARAEREREAGRVVELW
ncbi:thioredoxin fold domain-containing protein [Usitatibacter palustris]|uniref:Thioredoxin domain-containing protein n=1 Tax=Usitatibacter palustris TaxID=2732487 RepID=A0A6M4H881_9PROT|nr:thioredoxin fold domain-containing protein [Usitatibacter palustris]QJR15801.1 hypothetical protein DSM104440_02627 [Usitatibacter palustris]